MSHTYLVEWVRQLCGDDAAAHDAGNLTTAELTRLIVSLMNGSASTELRT